MILRKLSASPKIRNLVKDGSSPQPEIDIEEYASMNYPASELVYLIQKDVSAERFDEL